MMGLSGIMIAVARPVVLEADVLASHPRPFNCNITPRSEHTRELVYDLLETLEATDSQVPY